MNNKEITFEDVEKVLNKNKIRTRTLLRKKSRKLYKVLLDISKKWNNFSDKDREIITQYFVGLCTPKKDDYSLIGNNFTEEEENN